jgi:hypothetical protein
MRSKQGANPEFAFLFPGGEGSEYFQWTLYCNSSNPTPAAAVPSTAHPAATHAAAQQQQQQQQQQPWIQAQQAPQPLQPQQQQQLLAAVSPAAALPQPQDTAAALAMMPAEVSSGWSQVLHLLSGSTNSIKQSQAWFMACLPYATGMAEAMVQYCAPGGPGAADYQKQLHIVYLANDILLQALTQRAAGVGPEHDAVALAFKPRVGRMMALAYDTGGKTPEVGARTPSVCAYRNECSCAHVPAHTLTYMGRIDEEG